MLAELYIQNFAIIDELRLRFDPGFNVLTGETGAGKSIILDAMTLVLGGRADTAFVRAGSGKAYVEATFHLNHTLQTAVSPLLLDEGLDDGEGDDVLILARELRTNGRNICRVNGRTVNLSLLRQLAEPLIDIHGQGEHLSLLRPRAHLPLLDAFAAVHAERKAVSVQVSSLRQVQNELDRLKQDERTKAQRVEMLKFQIEEIHAARLQPNEEEDLRSERTRLANAEQLMQSAHEAVTLLTGAGDDDSPAVADMLGQAERALVQLTRYDDTQSPQLENLQGVVFQVSELSSDLQNYLDGLEYDPSRLSFVEERLELINRLKRKYGDDITAVLALANRAEAELEQISNSEDRIVELEQQQGKLLHKIGGLAKTLSDKRKKAAQKLAAGVESHLGDLSMENARFSVDFQTEPDERGAPLGDKRVSFDHSGFDKVEFLLSTNPGEPMKPMAKVASGGETARIMLALKTALAQVDTTPTLIFDEIDQGIGGRIGDVVGRKLWGLSGLADHQVIVVTHLPQLAGYGDVHYHVSKAVDEGRTKTAVSNLDITGRISELAEMLGTLDDSAKRGAESILSHVRAAKNMLKTSSQS